jgi:hypothetical protein
LEASHLVCCRLQWIRKEAMPLIVCKWIDVHGFSELDDMSNNNISNLLICVVAVEVLRAPAWLPVCCLPASA